MSVIIQQIKVERMIRQLYRYVERYGLNHELTIMKSQELDKEIEKVMKVERQ